MSDDGEKNEWMYGWSGREKKKHQFWNASVCDDGRQWVESLRKRNQTMRFLLFYCVCDVSVQEIRTHWENKTKR